MAYINLHDPSIRDASAKEIANIYREYIGEIPDSESFSIGTQIGRDQSAPDLEFNITSPDSDTLTLASEEFMGKLRSYDSIYDVNTSLNSAATELQISLKPNAEKIGKEGISLPIDPNLSILSIKKIIKIINSF